MSSTENLKFKLVAKVVRFYGSNSQERALADVILYITGMTIDEAKQYTIDELEQIIANAVSKFDDIPLPPRGKDRKPRTYTRTKKEKEEAKNTDDTDNETTE